MEYVNNSHYLGQKCARIFSQGHFLFQDVNCFPRVKLKENCELWGIDNFQEQMYKHIFAPNEGCCGYLSFKGTGKNVSEQLMAYGV